MAQEHRRIVTGENDYGKSCVVLDSRIPITDARAVHWFTERTADALRDPPEMALERLPLNPPAGATTFQIFAVPPEDASYLPDRLEAYYAKVFAGTHAVRGDTARHPGMHRTATIDYIVVLEGELTMILGSEEVVLRPFDTIVQRGTEHAWTNRGTVPAVFAVMSADLSIAGLPRAGDNRAMEFAALFLLTPAESELALALAGGQSLTGFAAARGISINTVRTHAARLRSKLGARDIAEIVRITLGHTNGSGYAQPTDANIAAK